MIWQIPSWHAWVQLLLISVFTGSSRVAKYAQSCLEKGTRFNIVPHSMVDAGKPAGVSLSFIQADFMLNDMQM
jgi:hypothetical protein